MRQGIRDALGTLGADLRSTTFVSVLDLSRWVAAGLVFVAHLRNPMFVGYGHVPPGDRTWWVQAWYFVTGWHAEAVTVFFVLSGLLVGGAGVARVQAGRFAPRDYAIDRVTRLYLAFLPALALGLVLDLAGSHYLNAVGFWDHTHPLVREKINALPFASTLTARNFLGNVLMLQNFYVPPLGSNQPLWTISGEFWFYAVFLLALLALTFSRTWTARAVALLLLAAVFIGLGTTFVVLLGLWMIGTAVAVVPRPRWLSPVFTLPLFLLALIVARAAQGFFDASAVYRDAKNYAVAIAFAMVLVSLRGRRYPWLERIARPNAFMASFSYSLYLLHFPLMLFVLAALYATGAFPGLERGFLPTEGRGLLLHAVTIGIVYVASWLFSRGTEQRTNAVRRVLKQWLTAPPARPAPRF
jgi:peptidoglycan/LPS O-acetylase OafA/YrhL